MSLNTTTMYHQMILDYHCIHREMRMGNKRRTNNLALWSISIKSEEREEFLVNRAVSRQHTKFHLITEMNSVELLFDNINL